MAKNNTIKVSTMNTRFEKLHTLANLAEECYNACAQLLDDVSVEASTPGRQMAVASFSEALDTNSDHLAQLASAMQQAESGYYDHLSEDGTMCTLPSPVPVVPRDYMPNVSEINELLYDVGYYDLGIDDDDEEEKEEEKSLGQLLGEIQSLTFHASICIKALQAADYTGCWEFVGRLLNDPEFISPDTDAYSLRTAMLG